MQRIKDFFVRYSYDSVKMLLDQVVLSIFGFSMAIATLNAESATLLLWTCIGSIVFYLALISGVAWKMGVTDRSGIEMGNRKFKPFTGTLVSLVANLPNLLVAFAFMINTLVSDGTGISGLIGRLLNGMYLGLMTLLNFNGKEIHYCLECELCTMGNTNGFDCLHAYWWTYILITIPAILTSTIAYIMGAKGKMLSGLMRPTIPESDRPTRKEVKERRAEEKMKTQLKTDDRTRAQIKADREKNNDVK